MWSSVACFNSYWLHVRGQKLSFLFNPIQDSLFRGCSQMRRSQKATTPSLKSVTNILQKWNLAQLYLKEDSKKYMNLVSHPLSSADISIFSPEISKFCYIKCVWYHVLHPLSSADISIFSPEISKFCYIKKYRCRFHFHA